MFGYSQNFVLFIAFSFPMSASSHASALYRERSEFSQIQRLTSLCLLEFSGFYILFNLQFSRFASRCFAIARIFYHILFRLSTTFLFFFVVFSQLFRLQLFHYIAVPSYCQQLFKSFFDLNHRFLRWNYNISLIKSIVKDFFQNYNNLVTV